MSDPRRSSSSAKLALPGLRREIVLAIILTASALGFSAAALVSTLHNGPAPAGQLPLR